MTSMNSLCCFTASSKESEVPDSKHVSGRALSEKLSSERTKKQHIFLEWKLPQHISRSIRNYFKKFKKDFPSISLNLYNPDALSCPIDV